MKIDPLVLELKTKAVLSRFEYDKVTGKLSHSIEHTGATLSVKQTEKFLAWVGLPVAKTGGRNGR